LEGELEELEEKRNRLAKDLELAATDAEKVLEISAALEKIQADLEDKEMRWLELSEFAE
jgi:ATP-binding cassette subfamily F protein uup